MANRSYDRESERYGRRSYDDYDSERRGGRRDDRGFFERAGDEMRSWFGDDEAERRRRTDQERSGRSYYDRDYDRYGARESEYGRGYYGSDYGRGSYGSDYGSRGYEGERYGDYGQRGYEGERYGSSQRGYESGAGWIYGGYEPSRYSSQNYGQGYGSQSNQGYGSQSYGSQNYGQGYGYGSSYGQTGREQGQYAGRGPQGYKRSDSRIEEDVNERLTEHSAIDAENIQVSVKDGEVTLSGTVNSRMEKRFAEDVAENCSGVKEVHNQLRVQERQHWSSGQQSSSTTGSTTGSTTTGSTTTSDTQRRTAGR